MGRGSHGETALKKRLLTMRIERRF